MKILSLFVLVTFLFFSKTGNAQPPLNACYEDWPPYMHHEADGHKGPVISVIHEISKRLDLIINLKVAPYARCVRDVQIGQADLILGISGKIENIINTELPIVFWNLVPLVHQDSNIHKFESLDQFRGQTVLVESTFVYPPTITGWLKSNETKTRRFQYGEASAESDQRPLRIIEKRQADVFFEDQGWLMTQVGKYKPKVRILAPAVVTDPNFIGFQQEKSYLKQKFDRVMKDMLDDGTISNIFDKESNFDWKAAYQRSQGN